MVSHTIVSRFRTPPLPWEAGTQRKLRDGPLYAPNEVIEFLEKPETNNLLAWTRDCITDLQQLELDAEDLSALVRAAVTKGKFLGSEWCQQHPAGPWAACDAYSATRNEWNANVSKELSVEYYIKFAISKSETNILLASCHLPKMK